MANLPAVKNQENLLEDIGLMTIENFYELEKVNTSLLKLQDIFTSVERTLRSSFDLQKQDFEFKKLQQQDFERQQLEQSIEQQPPVLQEEGEIEKPKFLGQFGGIGGFLSKLLGGVALGGLAYLFKDELSKIVETGLRTFFSATGTRSQFTDEISKILADNALAATIAGAIITPLLGPLKGAIVGGVILLGTTISDYIRKEFDSEAGTILEYSLYGATIARLFGMGPQGMLFSAVVGGVIALGQMLVKWFEGEKEKAKQQIEQSSLPPAKKEELKRAVETSSVSTAAAVARANVGAGATQSLSQVMTEVPPATAVPGAPVIGSPVAPDETSFLQATALLESGGDPAARAKTSTASGMFQFTEKTWMDTVKQMGKDYTLEDRFDPQKSAEVMAYFTTKQRERLERALGRKASNTDLYLAHFLGAGGAIKFLRAMEINPDANAAAVAGSAAAEANKNIFYKDGKSRSVSEVYDLFRGKMEAAEKRVSSGNIPAPVQQLSGVGAPPPVSTAAISPVGTTTVGAAVIGGTQATQVARDNMVVNAPIVNSTPINNVTNIATTQRKTIVTAQSPRMSDPTFMRVQELNYT